MQSSLIVTEKEIQDFLETSRDNHEVFEKNRDQVNDLLDKMTKDIIEQAERLTPVFSFLKERKFYFYDEFSSKGYTKGPVLHYDGNEDELYFYCVESARFKKVSLYDNDKPAQTLNPRLLLRDIKYENIMTNLSVHLQHYSRLIREQEENIQNLTDLRRKFAPEFN